MVALIVLAVALSSGRSFVSNQLGSSFGRSQWVLRPLHHVMYSTSTTNEDVVERIGTPHSAESKAKISAANKGKKPWNAGKQHSEETKRRIAEKTKEAMIKRKLEQDRHVSKVLPI